MTESERAQPRRRDRHHASHAENRQGNGSGRHYQSRTQRTRRDQIVLFDRYFKDANFDEQNRTLFVFASDNAGPSRIAKLRGEAKDHGLAAIKKKINVQLGEKAQAGRPLLSGFVILGRR
jgi:hypothetical protein